MKVISVEKLPKEVLQKAKIIGNVFTELKTNAKVLAFIEELVGGDFSEDMEFKKITKNKYTQKEAKQMAELIAKVYRISHAYGNHSCYSTHKNWRDEVIS